ncbi:MAG: response regulator transcription factor [Bacteroidia bacterium]
MTERHIILTWFENKEEEQQLAGFLGRNGFSCISCNGKNTFDELLYTTLHSVSLVIIDLSLKETDAILACNEIKNKKSADTPFVIIVSDKTEEFTQVTALDLGADDYIIKPVKAPLLLKRIEAILSRRRIVERKTAEASENFFIDTERHVVFFQNTPYELPRKEFEILTLFNSSPNKIFSREEIALMLWRDEKIAKQRTIDVHIRNIRRILGGNLIKTVKGFGYGMISR